MTDDQATLPRLFARIDELESRESIRKLAFDYCHGFDKRDYPRFLSIWWEDCIWDIGPPFGRFEGHCGIHEAIYEVLWPAWKESHHLATNNDIVFDGTHRAHAVCDVDCVGMLVDQPDCQIVGASYYDQLERRDGIWKILVRKVDIHYFNPLVGSVLSAPTA